MNTTRMLTLCVIFFAGMVGVTSAATWTIYGVVSDSFNLATGNSTGFTSPGAPSTSVTVPNHLGPYQYLVDFYTTISSATIATGMRGFESLVMDLKFDGFDGNHVPVAPNSLYANDTSANSDGDGYFGDNSRIDTNGGSHASGTTDLWGDNSDFGNPTDMQDIVASIAVIPSPNVRDPRPFVGQTLTSSQSADVTAVVLSHQTLWDTTHDTTYIGSIAVDWNGAAAEMLTATIFQASYADTTGQLQLDTGNAAQGGTFSTARVFNNLTINFQGPAVVPEPASLVLLALGVPALELATRRRRRT